LPRFGRRNSHRLTCLFFKTQSTIHASKKKWVAENHTPRE
jgi:hypothetical protein